MADDTSSNHGAPSADDASSDRPGSGPSIQIKEDAPVLLRMEVDIEAPPPVVWATLTDVQRWPLWHKGVDFADLRGPLEPGSELRWRADNMRIRSSLREVDVHQRLGWTMGMLGARGYQRWILESSAGSEVSDPGVPADPGALPGSAPLATRVRLEEAWGGWFAFFLRKTLRRTLTSGRTHWLASLRIEAERRASAPDSALESGAGPGAGPGAA